MNAVEWSAGGSIDLMAQYYLTQLDCEIIEKISNDIYVISCNTIKNMINDLTLQ